MKHMRKIFAILLTLILVMSLATAVSATTNDSITVNSAVKDETYDIYKLFDLSVNDEEAPTRYAYTVNSNWATFFSTGAGASYITLENGYVTAVSDAAALAKAAAAAANAAHKVDSVTASTTTVVFDGLENGYYLITSTLGTAAMIETTPDQEDVTVDEKNPQPTIAKAVKEDSTGTFGTTNNAQIGDTVEFQLTVTLYPNTRNVKVHDEMATGFTYTADSVDIDGLTENTDYTVSESGSDGDTFCITFADAYINALTQRTELTVTYSAILNENVVANNAIVPQDNTASITFGDSQSVEVSTTTTTHKFALHKYADGVANLPGATFQLKKDGAIVDLVLIDNNNFRIAKAGETGTVNSFTTVDTGNIVIWGVDADDDYALVETAPPAGYNQLHAEKAVGAVAADNSTVVEVENKSGTELPSTGGVGTTLLYIIGGILVLVAVVLLVIKKRMASAE